MKHTLKFSVANLYRQDSDFLINTILVLLCVIPITYMVWAYWLASYHTELATGLKDCNERITKIYRKVKSDTNKDVPDKDQEAVYAKKYSDYVVLLSSCNISWAEIIEKLEAVTPNGIRFQRISIRPDKVIKIKLDGKAIDVAMLTDYLRVLFESKSFKDPVIKNHRKSNLRNAESKEINFSLELTYVDNGEGSKQ